MKEIQCYHKECTIDGYCIACGVKARIHIEGARALDAMLDLDSLDALSFTRYGAELDRLETREYPMMDHNMVYPSLKCAGEAGELADKIGKHWRNFSHGFKDTDYRASQAIHGMSAQSMTPELKAEIIKEMGDVLWYLWAMCKELKISLAYVALANLEKLSDRKRRGVICSQGDNR